MATWLVTGANRGIGLSLSKQLAARGDKVIGVCRATSAALDASGATVVDGVDVSDAAAVAALPARIGDVRIDGLVLNAGIFTNESLDALDADGFARIQRQFEVNALGPLRVAAALQAQLAEGAKIGIVTSRMGSVADNGSGAYYGYRASKAAVNAIGKSLAVDLAPRGIAVFLLHPGPRGHRHARRPRRHRPRRGRRQPHPAPRHPHHRRHRHVLARERHAIALVKPRGKCCCRAPQAG